MTITLPKPMSGSQLLGVKPKTPTVTPQSNTLPSNQTSNPISFGKITVSGSSAPVSSKSSSTAVLGKNITSTPTAKIQSKLGISSDGQYGPQTTAAVKAYQKANGLTPDGIVGPQTLAKMFGSGTSTTTQPTSPQPSQQDSSQNQAQTPQPNSYTPNPGLYGQLVTGLANTSSTQNPNIGGAIGGLLQNAQTNYGNTGRAYDDYQKAVQNVANFKQQLAEKNKDIAKQGISLSSSRGQQANIGQAAASELDALQQAALQAQAGIGYQLTGNQQQQGALSSAGGLATGAQGLAQNALSGAAGLAAPQFPSYTSAQFNPTTGQYGTVGGGQYGQGPGAASNIQSVQEAQSKINTIDSQSQAISNNFSRAINYAAQAGLTGNSPILEGFKRRFGTNLYLNNPAVIGFNQAIGALNSQLQAFGEQPVDPNTATHSTLQQAQETVRKNLMTQKANYQSFIGNFNSGGSSSSSGGGTWSW